MHSQAFMRVVGRGLVSGLVLGLALSPVPGRAHSITDTYSPGDTLTAQKLDNIKSAVNDNDRRLSALFSGDGSAGELNVTANTAFGDATSPSNFNFTNVVIASGQTLAVPAGTVIRCSGSFTNLGTIVVQAGAKLKGSRGSGITQGLSGIAHPGDAFAAADTGLYTSVKGAALQGGWGGDAIPRAVAASSFNQFRIGGGSGGGFAHGGDAHSSAGGGLIKIYCNGPIVNAGTISAVPNGSQTGTGGGGGGIVVLASRTTVDNAAGIIDVRGGRGGQDFTCCAPGGGGGGGIVVMAAPSIRSAGGTTFVSGGAGVTPTNVASQTTVTSGGGGGASGGAGGTGGSVQATNAISGSSAGRDGYVLEIAADPAAMLF